MLRVQEPPRRLIRRLAGASLSPCLFAPPPRAGPPSVPVSAPPPTGGALSPILRGLCTGRAWAGPPVGTSPPSPRPISPPSPLSFLSSPLPILPPPSFLSLSLSPCQPPLLSLPPLSPYPAPHFRTPLPPLPDLPSLLPRPPLYPRRAISFLTLHSRACACLSLLRALAG